jgi:sugar phosphate isomerase/epimerase
MIDAFFDRIANVHIHDNNGDRDAHMTIGDGSIDFQHVLKRLSRYSGNYIIESRSFESAVESQSRLESLLSS